MVRATKRKSPAIKVRGRKCTYKNNVKPFLDQIRKWARMGYPNKRIADALAIGHPTFTRYIKDNEELADAIALKELADMEVEASLYQRAMGYESTEVTYEESTQGVRTKTVTKQVEPNVTAQIYWLKNRKPDQWRDKTEVESTGDVILKFDKDDEKV
jgi:hypothetical protein